MLVVAFLCVVRATLNARAPATTPQLNAAGRLLVERPIFVLNGANRADSLGFFDRADDQIMGGISQSAIVAGDGDYASFLGIVRTEGGGFCGVRSRLFSKPLDLSGQSGLYLRVRGDGKRYKINVRTNKEIGELVYQCAFLPPPSDAMRTIRLPFSAFRLVRRSTLMPGGPPLDPTSIYQLGIVLSKFGFGEGTSNDAFAPGPFRLDVAEIGAFRNELDFQASLDDTFDPPPSVSRSSDPALSTQLEFWEQGKEPRSRSLRGMLTRFVLARFRGTLKRRVAEKRGTRARFLLARRKEGKALSELRDGEAAGRSP